MEVLQIKQYHERIAQLKWNNCDKVRCIKSMFFFYLDDNETKRKNGYIAFDEKRACFGMTPEKAKERFYN